MTLFNDPNENNQNSLFNDNNATDLDTSKNYLQELVGEDKKFKTVDDLAKGKAEADLFIKRLLDEKRDMENQLREKVTLDDLMKRLENRTPPPATPQPPPRVDVDVNQLTEEKVLELIGNRLSQQTQTNTKKSNLDYVRSELEKQYGPNFGSKIDAIRAEYGMTKEQAEELASVNPKLFLSSFALKQSNPSITNPPNPTQNLPFSNGQVRDYKYYQELRKKDKSLFFSGPIQKQMYEDRIKLGDKF